MVSTIIFISLMTNEGPKFKQFFLSHTISIMIKLGFSLVTLALKSILYYGKWNSYAALLVRVK
jgi:hypothetical protein